MSTCYFIVRFSEVCCNLACFSICIVCKMATVERRFVFINIICIYLLNSVFRTRIIIINISGKYFILPQYRFTVLVKFVFIKIFNFIILFKFLFYYLIYISYNRQGIILYSGQLQKLTGIQDDPLTVIELLTFRSRDRCPAPSNESIGINKDQYSINSFIVSSRNTNPYPNPLQ